MPCADARRVLAQVPYAGVDPTLTGSLCVPDRPITAQLRRLTIRHPATGELVTATDVFGEDHIWFDEVA